MSRIEDETEMHYAPLLEARVPCDLLEVQFVRFDTANRKRGTTSVPEDATDENGHPIMLLATDRVHDLQDQICMPGRYRIIARNADGTIFKAQDRLMRPRRGRRSPEPLEYAPRVQPDRSAVEDLLQRQVETLEKANGAYQSTIETLQTALRDKSVEEAAASTRVAGLEARIAELEGQRDELRDSLHDAQNELEGARKKLQDADFSPIDALGAMDDAIGSIRNTVRMFSKDDDD